MGTSIHSSEGADVDAQGSPEAASPEAGSDQEGTAENAPMGMPRDVHRGMHKGVPTGVHSVIPPPEHRRRAFLVEVPLSKIVPNEFQPRKDFDGEALASLTASIAELGVLQPILVRETPQGQYELIAGERRWRAATAAGLLTIPAVVRRIDDVTSLEQALVENIQRHDLHPLEEAAAYRQLIDEFGLTQDDVAKRVGRSRPSVANTIRLLLLPGAVQRMIAQGQLGAGHARALLGLDEAQAQISLAKRAKSQGLSVRQIEEIVREVAQGQPMGMPKGTGSDATGSVSKGSSPAPGVDVPSAAILEVESRLADYLSTRVKVAQGTTLGHITIDFADDDDLSRLFGLLMSPEEEASEA